MTAEMTRRECLKKSARTATGVALGSVFGNLASEALAETDSERIRNYNPKMRYRRLGRTNLMVSEMGLGGHSNLNEAVVGACLDAGINYIDTTASNREPEDLGQTLAKLKKRDLAFVCHDWAHRVGAPGSGFGLREASVKWGKKFTAQKTMENIEYGLKALRTDVIDIWRPSVRQGGGTDLQIVGWVVEAAEKARQQGKIRFMALSCHIADYLERAIKQFPQFDAIIMPYNYLFRQGENQLFKFAAEKDLGVITIKPFLGGSLFKGGVPNWIRAQEKDVERHEGSYKEALSKGDLAVKALQFILAQKSISVVIPGVHLPQEVENNVRAIRAKKLGQSELKQLEECYEVATACLPDHLQFLHEWRV